MIKKTESLISVVIPSYNHGHLISNAINSVKKQTYTNWEIIIVDNFSDDSTNETIKKFLSPKIKLFRNNNNGIIGISRNFGIKKANGEWIAFLDSDDVWYKKKLQFFIEDLNKYNNFDVFCNNEHRVDSKGKVLQTLKYGPYKKNFYKSLIISGNCLSPSATIVNSRFIKSNKVYFREKIEYVTAEDYDFWLMLAYADAKFYFTNRVLGEYLIHPSGETANLKRNLKSIQNILDDHINNHQRFEKNKDRLRNFINVRLKFYDLKLCSNKYEFFFKFSVLLKSIMISPTGAMYMFLNKIFRVLR